MVEDKVLDIIAEHFDLPKETLSAETDLVADLHGDSLDLVELIMAFEDGFEISIPDEVALTIRTIGEIVRYIEQAK